MGLLLANPPKPPTFATGGIVPGNSTAGDRVIARVNSGEGIFTPEQMAALSPVNQGTGVITNIIYLDGREIARSTAEYMNNAQVQIETRAIRGYRR
jgi:hypothetical protein